MAKKRRRRKKTGGNGGMATMSLKPGEVPSDEELEAEAASLRYQVDRSGAEEV